MPSGARRARLSCYRRVQVPIFGRTLPSGKHGLSDGSHSVGSRLKSILDELSRRKVISSAGWYLGTAFLTMQVVEVVFPYLPLADPDRAGSIVLALLAIGFPLAMLLSWVFDITPPRLRRELPRETEVGTALSLGSPDATTPAQRELRPDSVAVLPFENLSNDPENEYFTDGITDDIIMSIAHIRGLRVLSRSSVMKYKGAGLGPGEIASELGVGTIVSGSIRRSESRIRIVAEVMDARADDRLWSETYDRDLEDFFEIQSDVAARIATAVELELSVSDKARIERRGTTDPGAYDLYLRARNLWNQRTEGAVTESVRYLERALERDPDFALAHSGLAEAYVVLGIYGVRSPEVAFEAARASARTALDIDPVLGEAVAADACVKGVYDWDWSVAEQRFEEALDLAPSYPTAHQWYALNVLAPQGRFGDAFQELQKANELDPASSAIAVGRGIVALYARDYKMAVKEFEAVATVHPRFAPVHFFLGQCHGQTGSPSSAIQSLERAVTLSEETSETLAALGHTLALAGRGDAAAAVLARLEERATRAYVSPALRAQVLIGMGRLDESLALLDGAVAARATDMIWIGVRPTYDPLRSDARFTKLLARVGLDTDTSGETAGFPDPVRTSADR